MIKEKFKKDILSAIRDNQFELYYQPQFNLATTKFDALEALIRWNHPEEGLLLPGDFLPESEENGLIVLIGEWVLRTAVRQNRIWHENGLPLIRMAINVSGKQFQSLDFVGLVAEVLKENNIHPGFLEVELTENIILHNEDMIVSAIKELRKLGVSIALDDFGTGYSSISHLKKVTVDRIKIDKTFINSIHQNKDDATIVQAIITLAKGLNLQVLAEGVETLKQLQVLLAMECKEVQGFYFSEPLRANQIEKVLRDYYIVK